MTGGPSGDPAYPEALVWAHDQKPVTGPDLDLTTAELLLAWDRRRARHRQAELGMSEVGDCRRRAGYRLAGTPPSNPGGSVQAVIGTAVHHAVAEALTGLRDEGLVPPGDLVEHEVSYAGLVGHLDRYRSGDAAVEDTKTTTDRWLERVKLHGPPRRDVWQVSLYAAGAITQGHPVRWVVLNYVARDTGREWRWSTRFSPQHVRDALAWLDGVRSAPVDYLARDHAPDSAWCRHCPFRSGCWEQPPAGRDPRVVLYRADPDPAKWAARLEAARADKADAEAREAEAKGALDAVRPADDGTPVDVGLPYLLRWRTSVTRRLDTGAVRGDYADAGLEPPTTPSPRTVLEFVARDPGDVAS
ncbi:MAG: hypothetical protein ACRDSN_03590 [Pseudonocardiaceae bacterium]